MGIQERRLRERQEREAAILATTRGIAAREGWQAATIRRVAETLEVSAPTIYEHFSSKDALLSGLIHSGYRQCLDVMRTARVSTADPVEGLELMALAYWNEAWSSPELYQVMYGLGGIAFTSFPLPAEAAEIHAEVVSAVAAALRANDSGEVEPEVLEQRARLFRAVLHGLVTLVMADQLAGGRASGTELIVPAVRAIVAPPAATSPGRST